MREPPEPNSPAAVGWGAPRLITRPLGPRACPGQGGGVALALGTALCPVLPACRTGLGILGTPSAQSPPRWGRPLHPGHVEEGWKVTPSFRDILYKGADLLPWF